MKFPSILIKRRDYRELFLASFNVRIMNSLEPQMLSLQDIKDGKVRIHDDMIPLKAFLEYLFIKRHNTSIYLYKVDSSKEHPFDENMMMKELAEGIESLNSLNEYIKAFVIFLNNYISKHNGPLLKPLDWKELHEYEALTDVIDVILNIADKYFNDGYLDYYILSSIYFLFERMHFEKMFNPDPHYVLDDPNLKISSTRPLTVTYEGKKHNLDQYVHKLYSTQVGRKVSYYRVQYDTQLVLSILDYLCQNKRHLHRCVVCGNPFIVSKHRKKFCSEQCKQDKHNKDSRDFRENNETNKFKQRFANAYRRYHEQKKLSDFDLGKLNIPPAPEHRGTPYQQRSLTSMREEICNTLEACCNRYNMKQFNRALNKLISYQEKRLHWGVITQKEFDDWLTTSGMSKRKHP
jgi:hypothetical protein